MGRTFHDLNAGSVNETSDMVACDGGLEQIFRSFNIDIVKVAVASASRANWRGSMNDEAGLNVGEQGSYLFERSEASAMVVSAFDLVAGWIATHDVDRRPGRVLDEGIDDVVSHKSTSSNDKYRFCRHEVVKTL